MQISRSPWWIILILKIFLFSHFVVRCDEEQEMKIKRAIYSYQKAPSAYKESGKSDNFEKFQGASPFEQVLAALGISGNDQANIHTTVEYWPPDMDRDKFYQMNKGEFFPFVSWNYDPSTPSPYRFENQQHVLKSEKKTPENIYEKQQNFHNFPLYVEQEEPVTTLRTTTKQPEFKWKAPKTIKIKTPPESPKYFDGGFSHHLSEGYKVIEEIPDEVYLPKVTKKRPPKIITTTTTTTTSTSKPPKITHPKYFIHTSKIPASLPPLKLDLSVISSSTEESDITLDDAKMTDSGPVIFPDITTSRNNLQQRGNKISIKEIFIPHKQQQQHHHQREHVQDENKQQSPVRVNKRRKLKKKVKTSSIAKEVVVDIGNRGSSGTQSHTPPSLSIPSQFDVIEVTSTSIRPRTGFNVNNNDDDVATATAANNNFNNNENSYVDPKYSDMIDNLSKLTELSFNTNNYNTGISFDNNSSFTESPATESSYHQDSKKIINSDIKNSSSEIHDENMFAVLNMMKNSSSNISDSSVEELKKAVIDNDLPKVKRIVKQHMSTTTTTPSANITEKSLVTRGKSLRSRFESKKTKIIDSSTEKISPALSSTFKPKVKKPVSTTVRQVISTTKSSRQNTRTRPSTTPRAITSRSTKSIARRINTTRKSIKSSTSTLSSNK